MPGMELAPAGRGGTTGGGFSSTRSLVVRGSFVTGHLPVDATYFSTSAFSKTCPDLMEATGTSGAWPEMA
eukprot:CAMPEP_0185182594 /NCGR_PEP_ID=MMETSP1140-20130426/1450_1 /TAXON_ID=298111 /ORGANISM="Pavlova sp., Strain CCMP459" /LENGTH=69 /DNA_ID=CAMNT_0027748551 /DNA_START=38 /DNA_END=244 /DNA_ORIENTATION=+